MEIEILGINVKILYWVFIAFSVVLIVVGAKIKKIAKEFWSRSNEDDAKIGIIFSVILVVLFGALLYFWPLQENFGAYEAWISYVCWTVGLITVSLYLLITYRDIRSS